MALSLRELLTTVLSFLTDHQIVPHISSSGDYNWDVCCGVPQTLKNNCV